MYKVKEIYYTLQGEGFHSGRAAIFCRFSGCNLWSGRELDREKAICNFCDTDFVGTNGINGGTYTAQALSKACLDLWPTGVDTPPFIVCTGGEPLLQIDSDLISNFKKLHFEIAVETNGTIESQCKIDWVCVSPKANTKIVLEKANELKFVFPQKEIDPSNYSNFKADYFFLQPMDSIKLKDNIQACLTYIKKNPQWRLSLQIHKLIGIF